MFSARCPSCSAPVAFRHASAVSVVCAQCSSVVVRKGMSVEARGRVSCFERNLSPIQLSARGTFRGLDFTVAGVVRKGRDRVRWNEWFVAFDAGYTGWLAEGNGELQMFVSPGEVGSLPHPRTLRPAAVLEVGGRTWRVVESAEARVLAAEGELPFTAAEGERLVYADLRSPDGAHSATIDVEGPGTTCLWVGEVTSLERLAMTGLRPFTGWVDPAFSHYAGPEIESTTTLSCPKCGAPVPLRSPGCTVNLVCCYCRSELDPPDGTDGDILGLVSASGWRGLTREPSLQLGAMGTLRGRKYQIIGAMERVVMEDGVAYPWVEYLLHNPYHGFRFLVEDGQRHWSFVEKLSAFPEADERRLQWRDVAMPLFSSGNATVVTVLGEFYWQVKSGDGAFCSDYVSPPLMISCERTRQEVSWSCGTYLPAAEVAAAFGAELKPSIGVGPHQPNPYQAPAGRAYVLNRCLAMLLLCLAFFGGLRLVADRGPVISEGWAIEDIQQRPYVFVTDPFEHTGRAFNGISSEVRVSSEKRSVEAHLVLMNLDTLEAVYLRESHSGGPSHHRVRGTRHRLPEGTYVARVEIIPRIGVAKDLAIEVGVRSGVLMKIPLWLSLLSLLGLPLAAVILSNRFEAQRWWDSETPPLSQSIVGGAEFVASNIVATE